MKTIKYHYNTLNDFLIANELTSDGWIDDGGGILFPVKGREINAVVLFSDMSGFSGKTRDLNPTETLIFLNHFVTWITTEALKNTNGIIDKYIGDEIMIVFSDEFGSPNPLDEALKIARAMGEYDPWSFCPHMGLASGKVTVGYIGTPLKFDCTVVGYPVALAKRCADIKIKEQCSSSIVIPKELWGKRTLEEVFPSQMIKKTDGDQQKMGPEWKIFPERNIYLKNIGEIFIREIISTGVSFPSIAPEKRACEGLEYLKQNNRYWPTGRHPENKS